MSVCAVGHCNICAPVTDRVALVHLTVFSIIAGKKQPLSINVELIPDRALAVTAPAMRELYAAYLPVQLFQRNRILRLERKLLQCWHRRNDDSGKAALVKPWKRPGVIRMRMRQEHIFQPLYLLIREIRERILRPAIMPQSTRNGAV